jgi:hypothetical protein
MVIPRNYASKTLLPLPTENVYALRENKRASEVANPTFEENFQIAGQQPSIF